MRSGTRSNPNVQGKITKAEALPLMIQAYKHDTWLNAVHDGGHDPLNERKFALALGIEPNTN